MRTLVVADVHGNLAALEAVFSESFDRVVCLGDIVGYGPEPAECLRLLRGYDLLGVQGNHDRAAAQHVPPRCSERFRWLAEATAPIARGQLSADDVAFLSALPHWGVAEHGRPRWVLVHATPSDPLYRYLGPDPIAWREEARSVEGEGLLVGHTHIQFELRLDAARVVNPGSVGQPKDGDPRAAYAVIEDGAITLKRVAYDVERTVLAYARSPVSAAAVDSLAKLLRTGRVGDGVRAPAGGLGG